MNHAALANANALDAQDPLAEFRAQFHMPQHDGSDCVYLCGNSLGLLPERAARYVSEELETWREHAVDGHFRGRRPWMPYHELLSEKHAALVGAQPFEVVSMNTLTVNLHLMMVSFFRPTATRKRILIEAGAFPSDRYAVVSQLRFHGLDPADALIEVAPRQGEACVRMDDLETLIEREGDDIALVLLPGVQYRTGEVYDMPRITRAARRRGCRVGLDLAHAAGNVPLALHDWDVDFAVWCTYKYLNAGPGAVAGCFVHERHARDAGLPRFAGWWGHDKSSRFAMGPHFAPIPGAEGWQLSNPPILSLAPVLASLEIFAEAGMNRLRAKSLQLTGFLDLLLRTRLEREIEILTPPEPERRGCQLSLRLRRGASGGRALFERLTAAGVICDWREPDVIRIAPVPLYNRFADALRFVDILEREVRPT